MTLSNKPTVGELGVEIDGQTWQGSGEGDGTLEVAFVEALGQRWVLTRVVGDPSGLVLLYSLHEWECFLDGAKGGEFDDAAG
jgi:hypothetical protein